VAWVTCNIDPEQCGNFTWANKNIANYGNATREFAAIVTSVDMELYQAYNICFYITLANLTPWLLLVTAVLVVATECIRIPIDLFSLSVNVLLSGWAYTRIRSHAANQ
jgi:hypothetical protein